MGYDINAARSELTDTQIAEGLAADVGYDINAARAANMTDTQIAESIAYDLNNGLIKTAPQPQPQSLQTTPQPPEQKGFLQRAGDFLGRAEENIGEALRTALDPSYDKFPRGPELRDVAPALGRGPLIADVSRAKTAGGKMKLIRKQFPDAKFEVDQFGRPGFSLSKPIPGKEDALGLTFSEGIPAGQFIFFDKPTITAQDIGQIPEFLQENSATIAGSAAAAPLNFLKGVGASALGGAADEGVRQYATAAAGAQEGYDFDEVLKSAGYAAGGETAGRVIGAMAGKLASFISGTTGKPAKTYLTPTGRLNKEGMLILRAEGVEMDDLSRIAAKEIFELRGKYQVPGDKAQRIRSFDEVGANPTKSEITRDFKDQRFDFETRKLSFAGEKLRQRKFETDEALIRKLESVRGPERDPLDTGEALKEFVRAKKAEADLEIGKLYDAIRKKHGNLKVHPSSLFNATKELEKYERISPEIGSIRQSMQEKGIISKTGSLRNEKGQFLKNPDINTLELLGQEINQMVSTDARTNLFLSKLRNSIHDDIVRSTGSDFFKVARDKVAAKYKEFEPNVNIMRKYGEDSSTLVQDLFQGKIASEDVVNRVISKTTKLKDIDALKATLLPRKKDQREAGQLIYDDIRAGIIQEAINKAVKKGAGERGADIFSGADFKRFINQIGYNKMKKLFTKEELQAITSVRHVGELRIPSPEATNTSGTASVLRESVRNLPVLKHIFALIDRSKAAGSLNYLSEIKKRAAQREYLVEQAANKKAMPFRSTVGPLFAPSSSDIFQREIEKQ